MHIYMATSQKLYSLKGAPFKIRSPHLLGAGRPGGWPGGRAGGRLGGRVSGVSHNRHVCCVTQQTCLLCGTADMSAV